MNLNKEDEKELDFIIKQLETQKEFLQYNIDKIKAILNKNR